MWIAGALVVSTLAVYAPVTSFDFVRYDDLRFVAENELVRGGLSAQGLRWAFLEPQQSFWNPLSYVSHMLDAELFGGWAGGHHATNALLHTLDSLLLFC